MLISINIMLFIVFVEKRRGKMKRKVVVALIGVVSALQLIGCSVNITPHQNFETTKDSVVKESEPEKKDSKEDSKIDAKPVERFTDEEKETIEVKTEIDSESVESTEQNKDDVVVDSDDDKKPETNSTASSDLSSLDFVLGSSVYSLGSKVYESAFTSAGWVRDDGYDESDMYLDANQYTMLSVSYSHPDYEDAVLKLGYCNPSNESKGIEDCPVFKVDYSAVYGWSFVDNYETSSYAGVAIGDSKEILVSVLGEPDDEYVGEKNTISTYDFDGGSVKFNVIDGVGIGEIELRWSDWFK